MNKYRETPPLKKGDMVVMHTCVEARNPKYHGKVWRCRTDQFSRGTGVYEQHSVFLEGFTGSFAAEYLQKVDIPDQSEEVERLKEAIGRMHDHHGVLTDQVVDEVKKHAKSCVEHELSSRALKDKLQDALNSLRNARFTVQEAWEDGLFEGSGFKVDSLVDDLGAAIQRIQEGKANGISKG